MKQSLRHQPRRSAARSSATSCGSSRRRASRTTQSYVAGTYANKNAGDTDQVALRARTAPSSRSSNQRRTASARRLTWQASPKNKITFYYGHADARLGRRRPQRVARGDDAVAVPAARAHAGRLDVAPDQPAAVGGARPSRRPRPSTTCTTAQDPILQVDDPGASSSPPASTIAAPALPTASGAVRPHRSRRSARRSQASCPTSRARTPSRSASATRGRELPAAAQDND